ncbi:hypothetical protein [Larsenimonas rhizosphaerae]|uniref:Uncharacterized protein n=1 Tax=Larsenimonas rhizosphaerae TaxID=2944682 RepID=A0AA41ZDF7_9GAMM|nr:hypothetical protein [Larsenimonas rhizosphaerae]MCM2130105.1 hypothetical protein [Larsenimonas rhizosphaerae]MCX2522792.1 hypothetical protein [Larsenimonas rhizosphaerae]
MDANPVLQTYLDYLDETTEVEVVEDHAARLTNDGVDFMLIAAEDEPSFFQLLLPNAWPTGTDDQALMLEAANEVMNTLKAVKIVLMEDTVHLSVEQFVSGPDQGGQLLEGLIELLKSAAAELHERLGMGKAPLVH